MDKPIKAPYTDPILNSIRATLKTKDDGIPFLLLPVRLETRFMEVEKPLFEAETGIFEKLLGQFGTINMVLLDDVGGMSHSAIRAKYIAVVQQLSKLNNDFKNVKELVAQEITWLKQQEAITQEKGNDAIKLLRGPVAMRVGLAMRVQLTALAKQVAALGKTKDPTYFSASQFIDKLKYFDSKWTAIQKGVVPYSNPKNKRRLYIYLTSSLAEITEYYNLGLRAIEDVKTVKKNQVDQIDRLLKKIISNILKAPDQLKGLFKDKNWRTYIRGFKKEIDTDLHPLAREFAATILPRLRSLENYKVVSAQEIYFRGVQILVDIKRFNESKPKGYQDVKRSREKLDKRIRSLSNMTDQMVTATQEQIKGIQSLWGQLTPILDQYESKVKSVKKLNKSQKFGVKTTVSYAKDTARKAIAGLKAQVAETATFHTSQNIRQSSEFYAQARTEIRQLQQAAKKLQQGRQTPARIKTFNDRLTQATNRFKVASRKHMVLPQADYLDLQTNLRATKTVISNLDDQHSKLAVSAVAEMETVLADDFANMRGSGANPLDTLELPPVLTTPTKTVNELWLRIFPDDIHVHTHEEQLSENELRLGKAFWTNYWAASGDKDLEMAAWRTLRLGLGVRRAAWVAKQLRPRQLRFRENLPFFTNAPSKGILAIIDQLNTVATLVKPIDSKQNYVKIIAAIGEAALLTALTKIVSALTPIKKEQIYFLQKVSSPMQRIEGKLYLIQTAVDKLTPAELTTLQASLAVVESIFSAYNKIGSQLADIKALETKAFIEQQTVPLTFPVLATKAEDWTKAPHARTLPDRFVAITMQKNNFKHFVVGNPIPDQLQLGLDPEKFDLDDVFKLDAEGNLQVDEGMRWMTDYNEAIKVGMGISIPLSIAEAAEGFDRVLVLGIKDTSPTNARTIFGKLLENHHYSADGMSVLKTGTPTNNTEDTKAGFNSSDDDDEESFRIELGQQLFQSSNKDLEIKDGQRLATALGLPLGAFQNIGNSDLSQIANAQAINTALWSATMGNTMGEIWDSLFTYDNIERTKNYFTKNVFGRGSLPALRIGTQPYGILTTTAFSGLRLTSSGDTDVLPTLTKANFDNQTAAFKNKLQQRYDIRLKDFLSLMNILWTVIRSNNVKHLDNVKDQNPQQHFMNMLGLNATSVDYFFRYGINIAMRGPDNEDMDFDVNFKEDEVYGPQKLRTMFGRILEAGYFYDSFDFKDEDDPIADKVGQSALISSRIRDQFEKARLFKARLLDKHVRLNGEMVDGAALSETDTLSGLGDNGDTYIDWLLKNNLYALLASNQTDRLPSTSLLFLLLRQGFLGAYNTAALQVMRKESLIEESFSKKIGSPDKYRVFHSIENHFTYSSTWTYLFKDLNRLEGLDYLELVGKPLFTHLNAGNNQKSMADYLLLGNTGNANSLFTDFSNSNAHRPYLNQVKEVWTSLKHLNGLPTAELSRLMAEHIDLCTHRLDAWILGQANKRLSEQRTKKPKGLHMGAYGWIENLRPGGAREEAIDLPPELSKKGEAVYTDEDNEGFIHAPSINQGIAAAVLRSGYKANSQEEDLENTMAVNLSSARVRMALDLLEGVRNGLEVGAVLGFQLERGLHERYEIAELDKYIQPLRKTFPLTVPVEDTPVGQETARETNVINGMTLLDKINETLDSLDFEKDKTLFEVLTESNFVNCPTWLKQFVLTENAGNNNDLKVIIAEIDRMANAFDALGDLAISESVYQIVQGNHVRAAAMVNALAEGKNPPTPQIIDSPRSGTVVTQRVLLNLKPVASSQSTKPTGWDTPMTPRALAEPSLNNWLGEVLGTSKNIRCLAQYMDGTSERTEHVSVQDLKLHPIDVAFLLGSAGDEGSSENNSRLAHFVIGKKNLPVTVELQLKFKEKASSWGASVKSFYEVQPLLKQIKTMLNDIIPASASELNLPPDEPDTDNPGRADLSELAGRMTAAFQKLEKLSADTNTLLDALTTDTKIEDVSFTNSQLNELSALLLRAAQYGIANAVPDAVIELDDAVGKDQLRQLIVVGKNLIQRLGKAQKIKAGISADIQITHGVELYREMAKTLFDKQFAVLPRYKLNNFPKIKEQLDLAKSGQGLLRAAKTSFPMEEWIQSLGEVRDKMYATEMAGMLADTMGQAFPDFAPVQFPFIAQSDVVHNDHWLGIEYPDTFEPEEDKLSLVLMNADQLMVGGANAFKIGFIVDEWVEIIPGTNSTTGLAFNYDQPDATAPQSILLAVTPQETGKWDWDDLVITMIDTLNLAKNRAVEPDHLDNTIFSQTLPAIISEVVPPQLRVEMDTGDDRNPLGAQVVLDFADNVVDEE